MCVGFISVCVLVWWVVFSFCALLLILKFVMVSLCFRGGGVLVFDVEVAFLLVYLWGSLGSILGLVKK